MAGGPRRSRSARAAFVAIAIALGVATWMLVRAESGDVLPITNGRAHEPAVVQTSAITGPAIVEPEAPRTSMTADSAWWADAMTLDDDGPTVAADDDPRAAVLRGRLTVRQQPWVHPAGVEVRLTRSWLDSVVPTETSAHQRLPDRNEPRVRTDKDGRFVFRFVPGNGELFFLIGFGTEWHDYQKVDKHPRRGTEVDVGDVWLDQRGGIVGRVTWSNRPLAGATLRAVDEPLLETASALTEVREARMAGAESFHAPGSLRTSPVPDWAVRRDKFLPFPTATADRDGRFALRGLRPGSHDVFVVADNPDGAASGTLRGVLVAPGRDTDVGEFQVRSGEPALLRFVDELKKPWVGADVAFVHRDTGFGTTTVRTDANGRVAVAVPSVLHTDLAFAMPGGGPWLTLPFDPERDRNDIVVPRASDLEVHLVDEGSRLVRGGKVRAYVVAHSFRPVDRALPAGLQPVERGPGVHVGKWPCPLVLVASAPGFAPAISRVSERERHCTMVMLPMQSMIVRTHDLDGRPIAGALVRVQVHENPKLQLPGMHWGALANNRAPVGFTNDAGELTIPVWPTWFSLQASHPDYATSTAPRFLAVPDERRNLLMRGAADIVGQLTFQQRPAAKGFRVRARQKAPDDYEPTKSAWLDERLAVTGAGGAFTFRELCSGTWELQPELPAVPSAGGAQRPPAAFRTVQIGLIEGQDYHLVIDAQSDGLTGPVIVGTVMQDGAWAAGAVVRLRARTAADTASAEPAPKPRRGGRRTAMQRGATDVFPWTHRCDTDSTGDFRFLDLEPGAEYELRVDLPRDGHLQFLGRRVVRAGTDRQPARVEFTIATSNVRLQCLRRGEPFDNRMLRLRQVLPDGAEGARYDALLDANGDVFLDTLPSGEWTIEPLHGGYCEPAQFRVAGGQALVVPITILGI